MALISCPECGRDISALATSCPNCGYPIATQYGKLYVYYSAKPSSNLKARVVVDSAELCTLMCGKSFKDEVEYGEHKIELYHNKNCWFEERFIISRTTPSYNLEFACKSGFVHAKFVKIEQSKSADIPHCPTCGGTHIKRISGIEKHIDRKSFGLESPSWNKQFICSDCGYRW